MAGLLRSLPQEGQKLPVKWVMINFCLLVEYTVPVCMLDIQAYMRCDAL